MNTHKMIDVTDGWGGDDRHRRRNDRRTGAGFGGALAIAWVDS